MATLRTSLAWLGLLWLGLAWLFWPGEVRAQPVPDVNTRVDCKDTARMEELAAFARKNDGQNGVERRIQSLEFQCDPRICKEQQSKDHFLRMMDLCVGFPIDAEGKSIARSLLDAAQLRLMRTGFFADVEIDADSVPGGIEVMIRSTAATVIRHVEYVGGGSLLESELAKRLQLRRGSKYPQRRDERLAKEKTLAELYEQQGYFGTEVYICPVGIKGEDPDAIPHAVRLTGQCPYGTHGKDLVDIVVVIERGKALRVSRVVLGGLEVDNPNKKAKPVKPFAYERVRGWLLEPLGLFADYNRSALKEGTRLVLGKYREAGYLRARVVDSWVEEHFGDGTVEMRIEFDLGEYWKVEFAGNKLFDAEDLSEATTFLQTGYVDEVEIANSEEAIRSKYETAGYYFARVRSNVEKLRDGSRRLTFSIIEGPESEIQSVEILGNEALSDEALQAVMGTKPYGLLESSGVLQRAQIEADLEKIVSLYQSRGYLQANVKWWQVEAKANGTLLFVKVKVEEGTQTKITNLQIVNNKVLNDAYLSKRGKIRAGSPLSIPKLREDEGRILQLYNPRGYPGADIAEECSEDGGVTWVPCDVPQIPRDQGCFPKTAQQREAARLCTITVQKKPEGDVKVERCKRVRSDLVCEPEGGIQSSEVSVRYLLDEGPQMRVGEIFLQGNFRTDPKIIFQEIPLRPGDLFVFERLYRGQSNLRSLGVFTSVSIAHIGLEADAIGQVSQNDRISLVVTVEEFSPSFYTDGGLLVETRNLLGDNASLLVSLSIDFVLKNFFGNAQTYQLKMRGAGDIFQASDVLGGSPANLVDTNRISNLDYLLATELVFFDPRSIFFRTELTVSGFYTLDLLGAENNLLDKEEAGLRTSVRQAFTQQFFAQGALEQKRTTTRRRQDNPRNSEGDRLFEPRRDTTKISGNLTYDKRNDRLNPRRGELYEATLEIAADFIENQTQFVKGSASFTIFRTFFKRLTLGWNIRLGYATPFGAEVEVIPDDELFRLGGVTSLRGFNEGTVGPRSETFQPLGGEFLLQTNGELRFPLLEAVGVFGAYFLDGGFLVDCRENVELGLQTGLSPRISCLDDVDLFQDFRLSGGMGLRWLAAGQIPVALDYGVLLNRQVGEEFGQLHVNVGYTF